MKKPSIFALCLLPAALSACTSSTPKDSETAASTQDQGVMVATGSGHVFHPRSHPPHTWPAVPSPDLVALPALRTSQCFETLREERPRSILAPGSGSGFGSGHGSGGLAPAPKRKRAPVATKPRPAPAPVAPPAQGAAPPPPQTTPAPMAPAPEAPPFRIGGGKDDKKAESADGYAYEADEEMSEQSADSIALEGEPRDEYHDWGASIYLSNDDTMSLSSAQRVLYAIDRFEPLPAEHIRPHELLNYFSFETAPQVPENDFAVNAQVQEKPGEPGIYTLGFSVAGRKLSTSTRRNTALTFVVDRSGSMADEGRMDYLKHGLTRMTDELKTGDLVNLVLFDHEVCVPFENFVVGRDSMDLFRDTLTQLSPRGSTDLHSGLQTGYQLADRGYQARYSNRVVMITDALANTGVTDEEMIGMIGKHYDQRRIRLSGVGVGREFNDSLLDRLTEQGRGAYVFLGSSAEVNAVFGDRFISLIETTANDVHFRMHLPPSLRMNVFYGEESSTVKEDVQAVHYFAGTSQLFLSDLMARDGQLATEDSVMLTIEYEHPETGQAMVEEVAFNLGEISRRTSNVQKGRLVMSFIDGIADLARRVPERRGYSLGSWVDPGAYEQCELGRKSLAQQERGLEGDPEVRRIQGLWDRFCSRYEESRNPVRREQPIGRDVWPGAAN